MILLGLLLLVFIVLMALKFVVFGPLMIIGLIAFVLGFLLFLI